MKTYTLHVDSRDRDYDAYPTPSSYRLTLPRTYYNVVEARLLTAEIPSSFYVFEAARGVTTLRMLVDDAPIDVIIPDGNYTMNTIAAKIKDFLESSLLGKIFDVIIDSATMRCRIRCTSHVLLRLAVDTTVHCDPSKPTNWGLGYYLGFEPMTLVDGVGSVTSPHVASLNPQTYLILDIAELNNADEVGQRGSFAKIPFDTNSFGYAFYDAVAQGTPGIVQDPVIPRMTRLSVTFRFHDGTQVNFHNVEHSFTIAITCAAPTDSSATQVQALQQGVLHDDDDDDHVLIMPLQKRRSLPPKIPWYRKTKTFVFAAIIMSFLVGVGYYYWTLPINTA